MKHSAQPLQIGLDFDGVIADYQLLKSLVAKEMLGKDIPAVMMESRLVNDTHPLTKSEYSAVQREALFGYHADLLQPLTGAIEAIRSLMKRGHQLQIVTSRTDAGLESARAWLKTFDITLPMNGVGYGNPKRPFVKDLDIYMDDDSDVLQKIGEVSTKLILFNSKGHTSKDFQSVASWSEFLTLHK